jgi:hypothetical protein
MQRDYQQIADMVRNGEHLDSTGELLATCPRHGGGWNRDIPVESDAGALNSDHPSLEVAEQRAWQIKRGAVEDIFKRSACPNPDTGVMRLENFLENSDPG